MSSLPATDYRHEFIKFAVAQGALLFGSFKTKAGRNSPYFFNAGKFADGACLTQLSRAYAAAIQGSGIPFDMLYGPAYKGIALAAGVAMALAQTGHNVPFVYNRKEAKDHGEGGHLVGPALSGRVLIVDDVISAGTSVRESVDIIRNAGATVAGVVIAVDRQERGGTLEAPSALSAAAEVTQRYGIPVISVVNLADVLAFVRASGQFPLDLAEAIAQYRQQYGVA
jgi:orotate phosphoribosyltransferase